MSLSKLPEELVAQMASYLDYEDVGNLMESSKRNYGIIKAFKMDKMELTELRFHISNGEFAYKATKKCDKPFTYCTIKDLDVSVEPCIVIRKILEQCSFVEYLSFVHVKITNPMMKEFNGCKTRFGTLHIPSDASLDVSVADFLTFCKKFTKLSFSSTKMNKELLCDEVFAEIYTRVDSFGVGNLPYSRNVASRITDKTLMTLNGEHKFYNFQLQKVFTYFTIGGIRKILTVAIERSVLWDFGILRENQAADAKRYFEDENAEIAAMFEIEVYRVRRRAEYWLNAKSRPQNDSFFFPSSIRFEVKQPLKF